MTTVVDQEAMTQASCETMRSDGMLIWTCQKAHDGSMGVEMWGCVVVGSEELRNGVALRSSALRV